MTANIVLGLGYGDEGKGITTDFLASQSQNAVVIRFSGGQQAGHTVLAGGKKHIFASFGAGTLRDTPSYFTEHTTIYPPNLNRERIKLEKMGIKPSLTIHPLAKITTPYDVFANRLDVDNVAHGTCGIGIGKTMKRNEGTYKLHAVDLLNPDIVQQKLDKIRFYYGFGKHSDELQKELTLFMDVINNLHWNIVPYNYLMFFDTLIFEGSQGILLDMTHGVFPNVTYANTVSKNAHEVLDKLNVLNRNIYYVTRSYSTRHGAGNFQESDINLVNTEHETNVTNEWQGKFKTAHLDYNLLNYALSVDNIYSVGYKKHLVVTCLDQYPEFNYFSLNRKFETIHESYSPDSSDFKLKEQQNECNSCIT